MNHLTDDQLNEYMDRTCRDTERRQYDLHLAACAGCRARLAELQRLDAVLAALTDVALQRDLTESVLARLPRSRSFQWTPAFAAELGAAVAAALFAALELAPAIRLPSPAFVQIPAFQLRLTAPSFHFVPLDASAFFHLAVHLPQPVLQPLQLPAIQVPFSNGQALVLAAATLLLWWLGNAVLLRRRPETQG